MKKLIYRNFQFLEDCEKDSNTGLPAKQRFLELLKILPGFPAPQNILDIGGSFSTAKFFTVLYPKAEITLLNKSIKEIKGFNNYLLADAQNFKVRKKFDLCFAGEILEHLYNPDGLLASVNLALKENGLFILTTPNLSCLYNRLFLLLGWTPGNYSPSLRYITGNPFLKSSNDTFGFIGDHKSVFTWNGLKELLEKYGFEIIIAKGYSYSQKDSRLQALGRKIYQLPYCRLRLFLNSLLPHYLREGQLLICRKKKEIDKKDIMKGILSKPLWEM